MASRSPELETTLPDGTPVHFRPIELDDAVLLREEAGAVALRREGSAFHVTLELPPTEG